ncbi:MAG TPA: class I SAM-dependent methyltransferase [Solirubrobacteraceae bacterium]|jgi:SAM-dependent methyltransferase
MVPPRRLRARAGAPGAREYVEGGRQAAAELAGALSAAGTSVDMICSVLDFGCGAGRVLPWFAELAPAAAGSGCDVDGSAIAWARAHRPGLDWTVSSFAPPLPYAAQSFDLVYSVSVLSHLGPEPERAWLGELRRVLAPGGMALLSVHGRRAFEEFRAGRTRTRWCRAEAFARGPLDGQEFLFVPYERSLFVDGELPGVGREYGLAFHAPGYVRSRWTAELEVLDVLERAVTGWQDLVVCRKPA